jgi:hypothetical protein
MANGSSLNRWFGTSSRSPSTWALGKWNCANNLGRLVLYWMISISHSSITHKLRLESEDKRTHTYKVSANGRSNTVEHSLCVQKRTLQSQLQPAVFFNIHTSFLAIVHQPLFFRLTPTIVSVIHAAVMEITYTCRLSRGLDIEPIAVEL